MTVTLRGDGLEDIHPGELRGQDVHLLEGGVGDITRAAISIRDLGWRVDMAGQFICAFWVTREPFPGPVRGIAWMLWGRAADAASAVAWGRPALAYWDQVTRAWPYHEVRAWVACRDARAQKFARRLGFAYDAGPCHGFLPDGRDADLLIWRRAHGVRRRRRSRTGGSGEAGAGSPEADAEGEL